MNYVAPAWHKPDAHLILLSTCGWHLKTVHHALSKRLPLTRIDDEIMSRASLRRERCIPAPTTLWIVDSHAEKKWQKSCFPPPYFTDDKTSMQRGKVTFLGSHSEWHSQDKTPRNQSGAQLSPLSTLPYYCYWTVSYKWCSIRQIPPRQLKMSFTCKTEWRWQIVDSSYPASIGFRTGASRKRWRAGGGKE